METQQAEGYNLQPSIPDQTEPFPTEHPPLASAGPGGSQSLKNGQEKSGCGFGRRTMWPFPDVTARLLSRCLPSQGAKDVVKKVLSHSPIIV